MIYISHKLDEIRKVSDRIVMLTNGQNRGEFYSDEITQEELIMHMGGASEKKERVARDFSENEDMLTITDLKAKGLNGVSLNLKRGEIIGISGLAGSGQQELLQQIYGARKKQKEGIELNGSIAYVSGDRATEGVFQFWNIKNNISVTHYIYTVTDLHLQIFRRIQDDGFSHFSCIIQQFINILLRSYINTCRRICYKRIDR